MLYVALIILLIMVLIEFVVIQMYRFEHKRIKKYASSIEENIKNSVILESHKALMKSHKLGLKLKDASAESIDYCKKFLEEFFESYLDGDYRYILQIQTDGNICIKVGSDRLQEMIEVEMDKFKLNPIMALDEAVQKVKKQE